MRERSGAFRRHLLRGTGLLLAAMVLSMACGEGVLRLCPASVLPADLQQGLRAAPHDVGLSHPTIGVLEYPFQTGVFAGPDMPAVYHTDGHGFRNPSPWPPEADIVVLGDSVAFGYGVEDTQTWPALLAQWLTPHAAYEQAMDAFIAALLDDTVSQRFLEDFGALHQIVAQYGMWNSLAQTLLKLTAPGVPDMYQGTELWDLSLVDPDNRRPVDYALRQRYLAELQQRCQESGQLALVRDLLRTRHDGRIKLYVIWQGLTYRRAQSQVFLQGAYVPLAACGSKREHVCAFARVHSTAAVLVLVPRLIVRLLPPEQDAPLGPAIWDETLVTLPEPLAGRRYRHLLTGEVVEPITHEGRPALSLAAVFRDFPVAMLERIAD